MNTEEAKTIAEAIKRAQLNELTSVDEIVRAGEWVPEHGKIYWYVTGYLQIEWSIWEGRGAQCIQLDFGNVFPTEAIAEAAKKHAEFWRAFDMADEGGENGLWIFGGKLDIFSSVSQDTTPRWQTEERARAWVESHGGEAYVSEMLTKGRVFRFKWGGE